MKKNIRTITSLLLLAITTEHNLQAMVHVYDETNDSSSEHQNNMPQPGKGQPYFVPDAYEQNSAQEFNTGSQGSTTMSRSSSVSIDQPSFDNNVNELPADDSSLSQVGLQKSFTRSRAIQNIINSNPAINPQEINALKNPQHTTISADGTVTTYTSNNISVTVDNQTGTIVKSNAPKTNLPHNSRPMFSVGAGRMTNSNITKVNTNMQGSEKNAVSNGTRTVNAENGTTTFTYKGVNLVVDTNTLKIVSSNADGSQYSGFKNQNNAPQEALPSYWQAIGQ